MARSEYSRLRDNIMKQQKRLLAKGFYASSGFNVNPPTVSELGGKATSKDVEMLKAYHEEMLKAYKIDLSDNETGNKRTVDINEAQKYFRKQASKKGQLTKILNQIVDNSPVYTDNTDDWKKGLDEDDYETIVFQKEELINYDNVHAKIQALSGFISKSKNHNTAKHNESIVRNIGDKLMDAFEKADIENHVQLVRRLSYNAMTVQSDLDRAKTAYLEKDNGVALTEELLAIILGRNLTLNEAKNIDDGYDEPVVTDEYGEVIE